MTKTSITLTNPKKVHIIGIGGSGSYYLAKLLHEFGWRVKGSDLKANDFTEDLQKLGIKVFTDQKSENLSWNPDFVIASSAIPEDNPERKAAETESRLIFLDYRQALDQIFVNIEDDSFRREHKKKLTASNFAPLYYLNYSNVKIVGVTGTDGKTTTSTMIHHMLTKTGKKAGLITSVMAKLGDNEVETGLHTTTPPAQNLAPIIQEMIREGAEVIVVEITSHGLAHHRVQGLPIDVGVYTNITKEHLDFHKSWENLVDDKGLMISMVRDGGEIILNKDDDSFEPLVSIAETREVPYSTYSKVSDADLVAENIVVEPGRIDGEVKSGESTFHLSINVIGEYNVSNVLGALSAVNKLNIPLKKASLALQSFKTVEGRMQIIQEEPFLAIVDFAHTPASLQNALATLSNLKAKESRLFAVFGCAAQRDIYKRPEMGKIAQSLADVVVLTAEDPRDEALSEINSQIIEGMDQNNIIVLNEGEKSLEEIDQLLKKPGNENKGIVMRFDSEDVSSRKDAINWAIWNASPGDIVVATGKGHEKSLCFGTKEYPWSDVEVMQKAINEIT